MTIHDRLCLLTRKLEALREPGVQLCKHDWVGDDDCVYCRNEELESQLAEKDEEIRQLKRWKDGLKTIYEDLIDEKDSEIERLKLEVLNGH